MYFRLFPHVFLVKGKVNSVIQDVLSQEVLVIDSDLSSLIEKCERNESFDEAQRVNIDELVKLKLGKITRKPIFVDKLRMQNAKFYMFESNFSKFSSAVLQLTNVCNKQCELCGQTFCPMCTCRDGISDTLDLDEWKGVIDAFEMIGCKNLVLTGGDVTLCSYFYDIVKYIAEKSLSVTVCLHESASELLLNKDVKVKVFISNPDSVQDVIQRYKKFEDVTLCCYFGRRAFEDIPQHFRVCFFSNVIREDDISCSDALMFNNSMHSSKCKKITVLSNGDVYPCLGALCDEENLVGNVRDISLGKLANDIKEKFWSATVNKMKKCKDCEYRYTCDSCTFFDAERNCKYDVDKGEWLG